MKGTCYSPTKIDIILADSVKSRLPWNSHYIAALRGQYNETHETPATDIETLIQYHKELKEKELKELYDYINNPIAAWDQLHDAFPDTTVRTHRYKMIALLFSHVVDSILENNPEVSRDNIITGYKDENGKFQYGPAFIFNEIQKILRSYMVEAAKSGDLETVNKYAEIFRNWGALIQFALKDIKQNEGFYIGHGLTYAREAELDYGIVEVDIEESRKERWQEKIESVSPLGTASIPVRRALGRLYDPEHMEVDDLRFPIMLSVSTIHQKLMNLWRGMENEKEMMDLLHSSKDPYAKMLYNKLKEDPILRTQFFVDFSKSFQLYSMINTKHSKDGFKYKFSILNKLSEKKAFQRYTAKIFLRKANDKNTIFKYSDVGVEVNHEVLQGVLKTINDFLGNTSNTSEEGSIFGGIVHTAKKEDLYNERLTFLQTVLPSLGIELSLDDTIKIIKDNKKIYKLENALRSMSQVLSNQNLSNIQSFQELLKKKVGSNSSRGVLEEKLSKIFQITEEVSSESSIESSIRFHNNTYQSFIPSSFMGRFFDRIESIVRRGYTQIKGKSIIGTKDLAKNYMDCEFFYDKDERRYLNRWLEDLSTSTNDIKEFAYNFTYNRMLGDDIQDFDDFGSKKHLITMINAYGKSTDSYGFYPVFIMGDSGTSKFIHAPRYSQDEIIDGLYNVYLQERIFQKQVKEAKDAIIEERYQKLLSEYKGEITEEVESNLREKAKEALGSYAKMDETKFGHLTFLNDPKYSRLIDSNNIEQSVKGAIKMYMEDATANFNKEVIGMGLLEGKKEHLNVAKEFNTYTYNGKRISAKEYSRLSKSSYAGPFLKKTTLKGDEAIGEYLKDFFWNTKFATIMQMQLMTISPLFYTNGDIVELQKRYKEIHASGKRISSQAEDPYKGGLASERDYMTAVYFEEVRSSAEDTNKEFMNVIKKLYGEDSDIYKLYSSNKTTDGQSIRTLKAYRTVMLQAGMWNDTLEQVYNDIEEIRAEIRENNGVITEVQSERLSSLLATFSPIKPILYTHERLDLGYGSTFLNPVQYKCAECVMIPELMKKGSRLADMISWAEEHDVDIITANSTIKVGEFGSVKIDQAKNKQELESILNTAVIHHFSNNDYVIQTNITDHTNESRLFGTQSRKLGFANMKDTDDNGNNIYYDYYLGVERINLGDGSPVKLTAYNTNRFYVGLIASNILEDFDSFAGLIRDKEKIRSLLTQMTINNDRETKDNLRGYGEDPESIFLMVLYEGGIARDTQALLLSQFKKQVNKQKINGGSAVQVTAYGIEGYDESDNLQFVVDPDNDTNILYSEVEIPWDLSYTDSKGNQIPLKFNDWCHPDGNLKLGKVISESDPRYKKYLSYKDDQGRVRIPLIEEKFPGILSFIAYRIPTEEHYSMINCQIKRFTHKVNGGGTIKVPVASTTIAGFDFDIDKLYFMRREFKAKKLSSNTIKEIWDRIYDENPEIYNALLDARQDVLDFFSSPIFDNTSSEDAGLNIMSQLLDLRSKMDDYNQEDYDKSNKIKNRLYKYWKDAGLLGTPSQFFEEFLNNHLFEYLSCEEYDFNETPWSDKQTRVGRNNVLIQLLQSRLQDPQTIKTRTIPGGFENAKAAAKYFKDIMNIDDSNYDYSDPITFIKFNQQNQIADKLIGIFANHNAHNAMTSNMDKFELKVPISFGDHTGSNGLKNLKNPNTLTKELLAAAVDAVKEPILNFFNFNTITANSAALLTRLGYSFKEIGLLLNQPIVKEVCEYCVDNNIRDVNTAINNVLYRRGINKTSGVSNNLDSAILEREIKNYADKEEFNNVVQLEVIKLFEHVYNAAQELGGFVSNTKFTASNSVKSTFGGMYAQQIKVTNYTSKESKFFDIVVKRNKEIKEDLVSPITLGLDINDRDSYYREIMQNPFGYEQVMYDCNVAAIKELNKYYPYNGQAYTSAREFINSLSSYGINEDTINNIHDYMLEYCIANVEDSKFNPDYTIEVIDEKRNKIEMNAKTYYTKFIPIKLHNFLVEHPEFSNLPIFSYLVVEQIEDGSVVMYLNNSGSYSLPVKDSIRESWESLLDNPITRDIAFDLYMYSYYQSGFGFGVLGFNHLAPLELKMQLLVNESTSYKKFLNGMGDVNINLERFTKNFLSKFRDDYTLVYTPKGEQYNYITDKIYASGIAAESIEIDGTIKEHKDVVIPFILKSDNTSTFFKPAIMVDNHLYICNGNGDVFNEGKGGIMRYDLVKDRNDGINIESFIKYNIPSSDKKSIPTESRTYKEDYIYTEEELNPLTIEDLIEIIVGYLVKSNEIVVEEVGKEKNRIASIASDLLEASNESIVKEQLVDYLFELYEKNGCVTKDGEKVC